MSDDAALTALRGHLAEVRDSMSGVCMTRPAGEIFASARKRRSRRVLAAAGAACVAIGIALALAVPGGQARPVHVHLAAWSVDTQPDGTVTFELHSTAQPARLQRVLAQAGVPAMVRRGEICLAQGRHVLLPTQGVVKVTGAAFSIGGRRTEPGSVFLLMGGRGASKPLNWSWTITPAKIPPGARFVISAVPGYQVPPDQIQAAWEFVPGTAPVTCAKSAEP